MSFLAKVSQVLTQSYWQDWFNSVVRNLFLSSLHDYLHENLNTSLNELKYTSGILQTKELRTIKINICILLRFHQCNKYFEEL